MHYFQNIHRLLGDLPIGAPFMNPAGLISLCIDLFVFVCILCVFVSYCIVVVLL